MSEQSKRSLQLPVGRFRSMNGAIYSTNPKAAQSKVTTTRARQIMNELYCALLRHDPEYAEHICKRHNA